MNEEQLEQKAVEEILQRVTADGPPEPLVVHTHGETEWEPDQLRSVSRNELNVLGRVPDILVFLDGDGKVTGWRDDGQKGTAMPAIVDREMFRKTIVSQLDLPPGTILGQLEAVELPPLGWTHQAVLFLAPVPEEDQILRIWVAPETLRVIQCLYGPRPSPGENP